MEDYKERYENALNKARELAEGNPHDMGIQTWVQDTFPELKASEDENIRKGLIDLIRSWKATSEQVGFTEDKIIAWLERANRIEFGIVDINHYNRIMTLLEARQKEIPICADEYQATIDWFNKFKDKVYLKQF